MGAWPQWKGTGGSYGRDTAGCSLVTVNVTAGQCQEVLGDCSVATGSGMMSARAALP